MGYFEALEKETQKVYDVARKARLKGHDTELEPEVPLAKNLAERVEGLVGPENIAGRITELEADYSREEAAFWIAREIVTKPDEEGKEDSLEIKEKKADQAIRTALAILTEGVVAAPLEGIAKLKIKQNFDKTWYLAVYFAGPIRSAGGTAAALAVLIGDYIRLSIDLDVYKPTEREIERYVEEVELYESEVTNLQYSPSPEEVRLAVKNIPVEVTGEPTDHVEVSHRDLERVETNNIRGGALLAIAEGVIQKAPKALKYANKLKIDGWEWLDTFSKGTSNSDDDEGEKDKVDDKYMRDIIGGRPVLSYPQAKGGFRLRYGRSRNSGLAAMGISPITMEIVEFLAVGTQMKIERPGKGMCVVPCDVIDGPIVKLRNGSVIKVESTAQAKEIRRDVVEILFLGDILVAFGEFLRNNHNLLPAGWCDEWWIKRIEISEEYLNNGNDLDLDTMDNITSREAFNISKQYDVPLHPEYTYFYHDVSCEELNELRSWIYGNYDESNAENDLELDIGPQKRILEVLGVPHIVQNNKVIIENNHVFALIETLNQPLDTSKGNNTLESLNNVSNAEIMAKAPTYIGTRVGRPEKTKERKMKPAPHALFPIGTYGGSRRNIVDAAKKGNILVEISRCKCTECGIGSFHAKCPVCGARAIPTGAAKKKINLATLLKKAYENSGVRKLDEIKGVIGMISEEKFPEPLEKGILRAKNEVFTFKDATIRHDSTNLPITHFTPKEIGVSPIKLVEMGYTHDINGNELENHDQILEIKIQDVIISENCADYLIRVSNFLDDLLEDFYHEERFYNVKEREGLVGQLIVGLAPHTSAGVLGRVVGFTKAAACYAHPYFHSAKRRNCDSDEDSVMLLLDALINFSKIYLPSSRGGRMDAPLVLSSRIDPEEIDDESHNIDAMPTLPLELYEKTLEFAKPSDVISLIDNVKKRLGTEDQYKGIMFSHDTSSIHDGPKLCLYKMLPTMREKVEGQVKLAEKIRAVDQRGVVEGVLTSHFLPDMAGNSRAFSRQKVRCTKCNKKYRRIPLSGECTCGGNLILSISKGSVVKYLEISKELANRYPIDNYIVQRIELIESGINSLFESDKSKQSSLDIFL
ncbi:MAG: DNA polymerase II large subunit [Methanobacterium sp.]|uniref:DNA polymerase II large subunit n=1 Tax=Methanobacterium sp. TaxID=2164 RepID=UPI003D646D1B|nr:DNA polymerase II large subunit [Methanobacterium sp.]